MIIILFYEQIKSESMQANIDDETGECENTISVSEEESLKEFINKQG